MAKYYALYTANASGYRNLKTTDEKGQPFKTERDAINYGKGITGTSVYLITMSKPMKLIHP